MSRRAAILAGLPVLVAVLVIVGVVSARRGSGPDASRTAPGATPEGRTWRVSASADQNGDGSNARPFATIAEGLDAAEPGDQVVVGEGSYPPAATVRAGTRDAPIQLLGEDARIDGDGAGLVLAVRHSYITVQGFEVFDGEKLVQVVATTGVRLIDNRFHDADGECIRLRENATANEIAGNSIERCGQENFDLAASRKNGEGIYIGVAPEQVEGPEPDSSSRNWIHDNRFANVPAECVDVKEGSTGNLVENNFCPGNQDPDGAGFSSRGDNTTFRNNVSSDNTGAGIRLGGDGENQGIDNVVVGNRLTGNGGYGLKVERFPQTRICGNEVADNEAGVTNGEVDPSLPCPGDVA